MRDDLEELRIEKDIAASYLEVQEDLQVRINALTHELSGKDQLLATCQKQIDALANKIEEMEQLNTYQQSELEDKSHECQELQVFSLHPTKIIISKLNLFLHF